MGRHSPRIKVAVVTGSRAEFGLLTPVIRAILLHKHLSAHVVPAGSHFLSPARTILEVEALFPIAANVRMQRRGHSTRADDSRAVARGIAGFTAAFADLRPDWVVVLGDRIEAFAAASAAAIAGIALAHVHGGDRAEGIADESMRHAITKLAHLHLPATTQSAERIIRMGERPDHVHVVGSPAIDGLGGIRPMTRAEADEIGDPRTVVLLHPSGLSGDEESRVARAVADAVRRSCSSPVLVLEPNHDAGRRVVARAFATPEPNWIRATHLPRRRFLSLLKRLARSSTPGVLVGNSSAGLIEAGALGVPAVNIGPRQDGRERCDNVLDVPICRDNFALKISNAIASSSRRSFQKSHPYGDGRAGPRIARVLASIDPRDHTLLRKRNTY